MTQFIKKNYRIVLLLGVVSAGSIAAALCWNGSSQNSNSQYIAKQAPSFDLPDSTGKRHSLQEFKGQWVMVHFWATWCAPCLSEIPNWVELENLFKSDPIRFIAMSEDSNWNDAHKSLPSEKLPTNVVSLLDADATVSDRFGTFQFPETYLIDPQQRVRFKWVGSQDWKRVETLNFIRNFLQKG